VPGHRQLPDRVSIGSFLLWLAALACSGEAEVHPAGQKPATTPQNESLVLTTPIGMEVWFTLVRPATGPSGEQCVERGLEIRSQGKRTKVPLLYTGVPPELVNDTMMRAMLWKDCTPGVPYLVNLRTGQPVPEGSGNKP
jgi:hypothetical protein